MRPVTLLAIILMLFALAACTLPSPRRAPAAPAAAAVSATPDSLYTQAVQTVIAQLTAAAAPSGLAAQAPTWPASTVLPESSSPTESSPLPDSESADASLTPAPTDTPSVTDTPAPPTLTPTPTATFAPGDLRAELGPPTSIEPFDNSDNWALAPDEHTNLEITGGSMVLTAFKAEVWDGWAVSWLNATDFYAEITAAAGDCRELDRYGLLIRYKLDATQGYLFGISCDGLYAFRRWDGQRMTMLVPWTPDEHILEGPNQTNRLGVKGVGPLFTLFVNGVQIAEVRDSTYSAGHFGLFIGSARTENYTVKVDDLTFWEIR